jgi:hypothetical protein
MGVAFAMERLSAGPTGPFPFGWENLKPLPRRDPPPGIHANYAFHADTLAADQLADGRQR